MQGKHLQGYAFLSPFLVLISIFYIAPAILTIVMSFSNLDGSFLWEFVGFENYGKIFKDPNTLLILRNTILYIFISMFIIVVLDLFIATLTTYFIKSDGWASFFKSIIMIPMITPSVVYSVLWIWYLDASDAGFINSVLRFFNKDFSSINWIAQYPFQVIILAQVVVSLAYGAIIFSSAIRSIPENQFKAAHVDGASEWEIVKTIIIPNIRPHIKFIIMWETLGLMTNYLNILLITNGGPLNRTEVWALSAYHKAFIDQQYGYGAAISVLLILVVFMIMLLWLFASRTRKESEE
ncbi:MULTISPECIES: sugar ABC transporter permease [Sphaerochaeta]|jgi:inositol-phosphate transport system permease protein|uniref:Lactose transport system permease protein LacF n=1 Tax=bioreactor metagenome TaxID=1076179 RepID=A0A644WPJ1_9ZZZZ|nr:MULTISPECIES: sugar ABC transporter permease [Sphaerochaeta]MDD3456194.1 sugar ABC transporter permease [Sphaerochaeta sp.]MEA5028968.1 sugar ABC transporter permease [Sphaerochaeta associata]MEA5108529.1 sugar ABC transporter permease [Sphaerochaeta associata]NCB65731.1 sugar ABC transporter permease [Bacilli bacterium]